MKLQDLIDECLLSGWKPRPHGVPRDVAVSDGLRDPLLPRRALSPNEMYAALVAAAGYLPLTLSGEDYLELLPSSGAESTPTASASATAPTTAPNSVRGGCSTPVSPPGADCG